MNSDMKTRPASETELIELARLLDGANLIIHGFDGVISRWTGGCEALYGWSREEALGKVVHELLATHFPRPAEEIRETVRREGAWEGLCRACHRRPGVRPCRELA
ncbi:hypothetical protein GFM13_11695 [Rhizobium leguminosarum bv. viciae]|nr:hypothetical protein [Rhizobium leguminosarum bv. viciae]